jgi:ABC-type multidrug transport system fused ATPase/permease subunit
MVAILTMLIALGVLAWLSWKLALASVIFLLLGLAVSYSPGHNIRKTVRHLRRVRAHLMASIGEQISALATILAFGGEHKERRRFARRNQEVLDASIDQAKAAGTLRAVTRSMATIARALILAVGAFEVAQGTATVGTVAAAMTVVGMLSSRIRRLGRIYTYYQKAKIARHKISQFLAIPTLLNAPVDAPDIVVKSGRLEFRNVSFTDTVKDISVAAEAGELIALVGPNGAGKSTLLSLACRLIDPEKGRVLFDGQDLAKYSLKSIRRTISMVSSDLPLMRGSIRRNLRYRWPSSTNDELAAISSLCGLDEMLQKLPEGNRTRVLEGGKNFSLGERQRISLARAILGTPAILLLDEADTNLDSEATLILDRVLKQFEGTVIMVTHNPERIARANSIWYMDKGRIVRVKKRAKPEEICENSHE